MIHVTKKKLRQVATQIAQQPFVEKVILFGSYAYGRPTNDSDVDLLVVVNAPKRTRQMATKMYLSINPYQFPLDIVVRTKEEIQYRVSHGDWFLKEAYQKGIVLYEASN